MSLHTLPFRFGFLLACALGFASSTNAHGAKLDLQTGAYLIQAGNPPATLTYFGTYRLAALFSVLPNLEAGVGYTVIMSKGIGGDLAYGFDFALNYFPFTAASPARWASDGKTMEVVELWRPYVGMGFSQRQFQSVFSAYAGFNACAGVERSLEWNRMSLKAEGRLSVLGGPAGAAALEGTLTGGISISF